MDRSSASRTGISGRRTVAQTNGDRAKEAQRAELHKTNWRIANQWKAARLARMARPSA